MNKNQEFLSPKVLIGFLVVIFMAAFALNFAALSELAGEVMDMSGFWCDLQTGCSGSPLPYLLPILIDVFLLLAVLTVLRNETVGEKARLAWGVVAVTTLGAIAFNVLHYNILPDEVTVLNITISTAKLKAISLALIVPGAILLSSEMIRGLLGSMNRRNVLVLTTTDLQAEHAIAETQLVELNTQVEAQKEALNALEQAHNAKVEVGEQALEKLKLQVRAARTELEEARRLQSAPSAEWVQALQIDALRAADWTHKAACQRVGVSENTGRARLSILNGEALSEL